MSDTRGARAGGPFAHEDHGRAVRARLVILQPALFLFCHPLVIRYFAGGTALASTGSPSRSRALGLTMTGASGVSAAEVTSKVTPEFLPGSTST